MQIMVSCSYCVSDISLHLTYLINFSGHVQVSMSSPSNIDLSHTSLQLLCSSTNRCTRRWCRSKSCFRLRSEVHCGRSDRQAPCLLLWTRWGILLNSVFPLFVVLIVVLFVVLEYCLSLICSSTVVTLSIALLIFLVKRRTKSWILTVCYHLKHDK